MDYLIGQITIFAGNFAPRGWALCNGQLLPIAQYTALFSILGNTYGGDGRTTFALPDFRGRMGIQQGQGPGLTERILGEEGGEENVTLISTEMPAHNHLVDVNDAGGSTGNPQGNFPAKGVDQASGSEYPLYESSSNGTLMNPMSANVSGNSMPHPNLMPLLTLNYIICMEGMFPSRN